MSEQNKFDSTYSAVVSMAEQMVGEGKYDSTYSAVLAIYQNLTSDMDTKFDSVYSIVVKIANGIESGEIDPGGGGSSDIDPQKYNTHKFYNLNGELVEEWTLEETQSKTELPVIDGVLSYNWSLDFDGWNWDLEQLKSASCGQNIGAMYRPSDGKTRIVVEIEPENLTYVLFVDGDYTEVDWGDGTIQTEFDGYPTHTYESEGSKTIILTGTDIRPQWGVSPIYSQIWEGYPGWYYNGRVKTFMSGVKLNSLSFGYCTGLEFLTFTGDTHVYDSSFYKFNETKSLKYLAIPKGVTSYPTTGKSIEVISMPYGVTSVGSQFKGCPSLQSINIPDSVTSIGYNAFQECYLLQFINIPNSVTSINNFAFQYCSSLQSVIIGNGVTSIGSQMFNECSSLKSITIMGSVTSIGNNAFYGCESLQSITIPDSVTSIDSSAFYGCESLQSITIPDGVTSIGNSAFYGCRSLQSITIPDSVTSIGSSVFNDCYSLQSVTIPDGVTSIGMDAFNDCYSLQSVTIPDGVTSIGSGNFSNVFKNCRALQSISIPNSVTSIGGYAFQYCTSFQSIIIPDSVTSIGNGGFHSCYSLTSINIPDGVTSIGSAVFQDCNNITVDFSDNTQVPELSSTNAFTSTALILVPESLYDEWINATNWSSISSQIIAV